MAGTTQLSKSQLELLGLLLPSEFSNFLDIQCSHGTDRACDLQLLMSR